MRGYILNFFKYATFPSSIKSDMCNYLNEISNSHSASQTLLVYGDYDRISIEEVQDFSRFRDVSPHAQKWLGSRQTILLYELPNKTYDKLDDCVDNFLRGFCIPAVEPTPEPPHEYRNFLVFTMITMNPVLHNMGFAAMLDSCCELINRQIQNNNVQLIEPDAVSYQIYGSFSSSELALVWWVNQYVDAFRLIEVLRNSALTFTNPNGKTQTILPFVSLYSITAQPKNGIKDASSQKIRGRAELKFVFQDGVLEDVERKRFFEEELRKELAKYDEHSAEDERDTDWKLCEYSVGEYDYSIFLPAGFLCDPQTQIFYRNHLLHWASNGMRQYVSSSNVQLYYDMQFSKGSQLDISPLNCPAPNGLPCPQTIDLIEKIRLIKRMIYGPLEKTDKTPSLSSTDLFLQYREHGLRAIIKEKIPETDGLCDSLDLLFADFVNNCSNLTSTAWAGDLTSQFIAIIDYIANEFESNFDSKRPSDNLFSHIKSICAIYIQMIYHIAQSRRTVFVVPSCHLRYMGQYDLILHAYYGWEKYLLDLAYSLPHRNGIQPILVPVLTIDVLPEIRTQIYKIPKHYKPDERISNIFSINMPLGAMTDFLRYALTMCHETAHIIIPHDRDRRNLVFGMLFFSELVATLVTAPIVEWELPRNAPSNDVCQHLLPDIKRGLTAVIYNEMRTFFIEKIHNLIMEECRDIPDNCPPWEEYLISLKGRLSNLINSKDDLCIILEELSAYRDKLSQVIINVVSTWEFYRAWKPTLLLREGTAEELKAMWLQDTEHVVTTQKQKAISALRKLVVLYSGNLCNESYVLSEAYREACQDLFMIRVFQLDLVDYLVFIDRHRNDTVTLLKQPPKAEMLRITMVCDYILSQEKAPVGEITVPAVDITKQFDGLLEEYVRLLVHVPEMRKKDPEKRLAQKATAETCFKNKRVWLDSYFIHYASFRPLLLEQLKDADLFLSSPELKQGLLENKMHSFYYKWKKAVLLDDDLEMNRQIFATNIEMIQQYQVQDTFEKLASKLTGSDGNDGVKEKL